MVYLGSLGNFFKGCPPQILLGPFSITLTHMFPIENIFWTPREMIMIMIVLMINDSYNK